MFLASVVRDDHLAVHTDVRGFGALRLGTRVDEREHEIRLHATERCDEIGDAHAEVADRGIRLGGVGRDGDRTLQQSERLDAAGAQAVAAVLREVPLAVVLLREVREQQGGGDEQGGEEAVLREQREADAARGDHVASLSRSRRRTDSARKRPMARRKYARSPVCSVPFAKLS